MTDVIFLLLIFFMVTSTVVFPTALEVNLPQSSRQTAIKPSTRVYIDKESRIFLSLNSDEPVEIALEALPQALVTDAAVRPDEEADPCIAVYADEEVTYGRLVEVLDIGASLNLKMVLATKPAPASARLAAEGE